MPNVYSKGVYLTSNDYIKQHLGELVPVKAYWLSKEDKQQVEQILQHALHALRIKYWQKDNKIVFVLNEVGKEQPITMGITINHQNEQPEIENITVLAYRESRGDEVRHAFFTNQFNKAKLTSDQQLNQSIDGITGATLSVRALTKSARIALWLASKI
jgi:hypothetical protein